MFLIRELIKSYLLLVSILFIGRLFLYLFFFDRFLDINLTESLLSFFYGIRMDSILIGIILTPIIISITLIPKYFKKTISKILYFYLFFWMIFLIFIENATFPFFLQYDVRPNYLFLEYLEYPHEIASLLFKDYKLELLISFIMMILASIVFLKKDFINFENSFKTSYLKRLILFIPLVLIAFLMIRSSIGHRPANISDALYSSNRVLNEITKNSLYNVGYAFYSYKKNEKNLADKYGKVSILEAYNLVSNTLNIDFNDASKPFNRLEKTHFKTDKPKNLVIFVQESMGAQFTSFAGEEKDLTPNLNNLANKNLAFTNLYANGTRSVRGLEALTSGYLPIIGDSVIKRNKSQSDFLTIAKLLKPFGYKSSFIYGGEGRFDNMRNWYLGNGFDEVIEQKDFKNPLFTSTWGVSDEDLVIKANEKFKEYNKNKEPFVTVMFSQSNHAPFELPDNKIEFIENLPKNDVKNAIKYADFAIGKFFELAQKEEYYKDTVFVVVADHNVRTYGDETIPISTFKIPAVIIASNIKQQFYNNLSSQPDVLATALDLIGLDLQYPILGNSIFNDKKNNINFMLFNDTYAFRKDNEVAVLIPNKEAKTFYYKDSKLQEKEHNKNLENTALALIHVLSDMYEKKLYR
ncbi:LTA synthase family protein [Arcobacter aquimarinus]|uniref:Sulfatase n=2 Tax=Arcobacter aquimarinus TaxID=1315211 RepID=A0AAE7E2G2_9BACT|nr:sulfatase [Arcobacter aquimarinus]RXI35109.1 sulfatase [Arcobacter aquimarinus]